MSSHARATDPATSHAAARRAEREGIVETDTALFARLVREQPGITIPEMARVASDDPDDRPTRVYWQVKLNRRTGDVRDMKLAYSKGDRDGAQCWWPGPEPQQEEQAEMFGKQERREWD